MALKVNKQAVAQAFGRAAQSYNQHAELQRICGEQLMTLTDVSDCRSVLDAGCGTGWFSRRWRERGCQVTALDISPAMLTEAESHQAAHRYLQGDIDAIPLPDGAVDLCWSNLAVQWCDDLAHALNQLCRVTRPGGKVLFSTLAAESLSEVGSAWRQLDGAAHVNPFLSMEQIRAAGQGKNLQLSQQTVTLAFPDVLAAMRSLKGIGATHVHQGRAAGLMTRQRLLQLESVWPRDQRGCLLSYHLVSGVIYCD